MRTVGVLGGMGPLATAAFYLNVIRLTPVERDQDHVPLVILSDPSIPDRTAFLLRGGLDPRPALIQGAQRLRSAGAELLVVPCNTANLWIDEIAQASQLEPLRWLDIAVEAVAQSGARSVGLLATTGTLTAGIYQRLLGDRGVTVISPDSAGQTQVMNAIYDVKRSGAGSRLAAEAAASAAQDVLARGADALLLACTELPIAFDAMRPPTTALTIDPSLHVAKAVIEASTGRVLSSNGAYM